MKWLQANWITTDVAMLGVAVGAIGATLLLVRNRNGASERLLN